MLAFFLLTKIGCFRLTLFGDFLLTLTRMLELVLDELRKQGIDIKDRQEFKDGYLPNI